MHFSILTFQALEFDVDENVSLNILYDPTWLAILRATDALTSVDKSVGVFFHEFSTGISAFTSWFFEQILRVV